MDAWMSGAGCQGLALEMFFNKNHSRALGVCAACPVRAACRDWCDRVEQDLTKLDMVHGVFGGETPKARVKRRKATKSTVAATVGAAA